MLMLLTVGITIYSRLADDIDGVRPGTVHRWGRWEIFVIRGVSNE